MSQLSYNGVNLPYCFFTRFDARGVDDPVSGTDRVSTEFDIQAQAVVNASFARILCPDLAAAFPTAEASEIMTLIRPRLLAKRKTLSFKFNGVEQIPVVTASPGTVDVANGPDPQHVSVLQATNDTWIVTFHVKATYCEFVSVGGSKTAATSNRMGNAVLYNRWTESVEIDANQMTRRVREGQCGIRSDNNLRWAADSARTAMAVAAVPSGFLRESSRYTVTPDGLALQYHIVDREQYKMPPSGAFTADGTYQEWSTRLGVQRFCRCSVRLTGAKPVANQPGGIGPVIGPVGIAALQRAGQDALVNTAIAVVASKMNIAGVPAGNRPNPAAAGTAMLLSAQVNVNLYRNEVEVQMEGMLNTTNARQYGVAFQLGRITFTPFSDGVNAAQTPPSYTDRGSASLFINAAAYYDPSVVSPSNVLGDQGRGPFETSQMNIGRQVGEAGQTRET